MELTLVLCLVGFMIGMSKTSLQVMGIPAIALLAVVMDARASTGVILPILCMADLLAVLYYRRQVSFSRVAKLLPPALAGFLLALFADSLVPHEKFRYLMGACMLVALLCMFGKKSKTPSAFTKSRFYGPLFGLLGGFTTLIGNMAGPVMAIYLLSVNMPKVLFVGTNAWFFLTVNYLKIPLQVGFLGNLDLEVFLCDLIALPFILAGAAAGILLVKKLPEERFQTFTRAVTLLAVLAVFFC